MRSFKFAHYSLALIFLILFTVNQKTSAQVVEDFDSVTPPALPAGWSTTLTVGGPGDNWVTTNATSDSPPNSAFANDVADPTFQVAHPTDKSLNSPAIFITSPAARLTFRNSFDLEQGFDGGVFEISIAGGPFQDIVVAGGSFVTGGYTGTTSGSNPLGTRPAWTGTSSGFITTTVILPAAAAGNNVVLRWRVGTDNFVGGAGQFIDSIVILTTTAANGTITGRVTAIDGTPVAGAVVQLSGTQTRKTITDSAGNYRFDSVETNGVYTVTPSRANFVFSPLQRSFNQLGNNTDAAFAATALSDSANPLDTPEFFVRQQYLDFLDREPEEGGFNYWSDRILDCGSDTQCVNARRRDVAAAFFIEREFQDTGYFVYRLYRAAFGTRPAVGQYLADRNQVVGGTNLNASRINLADNFVQRSSFRQQYPDSLTNQEFVSKLAQTAGNFSPAFQQAEIDLLNGGGSRAQVLLDVVEEAGFKTAEYNAAFVSTEYFSYLRRDPEQEGYDFWLNVLNNREPGNYRGLVCSFITSAEYQRRFSTRVTHVNGECN